MKLTTLSLKLFIFLVLYLLPFEYKKMRMDIIRNSFITIFIICVCIHCKNSNIYMLENRAVSFCWGPDTLSYAYIVKQPSDFDSAHQYQFTYREMFIHNGSTNSEDIVFIGRDTAGYDIAWSPRGDIVAVTSCFDKSPTSIWFFPLDRKKSPYKMSHDNYINTNPDFSPDGKKIVFISNRSAHDVVCVKSLDSDSVMILGDKLSGTCNYPFWNPNGKEIIFTSYNKETLNDIYTVNLETGIVSTLIQTPVDEFNASYSPDGKYIVFCRSYDRKITAMWIKNILTGKEYAFSYYFFLYWTNVRFNADGTKIAFLTLIKKLPPNDKNVNLVYMTFDRKKY